MEMNKDYTQLYTDYLDKVREALKSLDPNQLETVTQALLKTYNQQGTIYIFGNGGSGATASHVCGDFIKACSYGLEKRFKMVCLNDNVAGMMAIANDDSYDDIFVEPLKNFLSAGDLVIAISGSGNSRNVIKAVEYANSQKATVIGFCGFQGGKLMELAANSVHVPLEDMEITEDLHYIAFHMIKQRIIKELRGEDATMGPQYDDRVH